MAWKKWNNNKSKYPRPNVKDVEIDESKRYKGEVVYFNRKSGFGFLKIADKDVTPDDKCMVHWKAIQTDDRWPFLYKGLTAEFTLQKARGTIRAMNVTQVGGAKIACQDEIEEKLEFVGQKNMRFLGKVKFYNFKQGYGYVNLEPGYDIDKAVPLELKVERVEIASGNDAPRLNKEMEVEFGIMKNSKGVYKCYNVSLPGGDDLTREIVEQRSMAGNATFEGTIMFWNRNKSYGWIKPETFNKLPAKIQTAMKENAEKAKANSKSGGSAEPMLWFRRGDRAQHDTKIGKDVAVTFKCYTDNQGVGACDVVCKE